MLALQQMGYRFSPNFVNNLLSKYDAKGKGSCQTEAKRNFSLNIEELFAKHAVIFLLNIKFISGKCHEPSKNP